MHDKKVVGRELPLAPRYGRQAAGGTVLDTPGPAPDSAAGSETDGAGSDTMEADWGSGADAASDADAQGGGPPWTLVAPVGISATAAGKYEAETHLVVSPGGGLLAVWMKLGGIGVGNGFAVSQDGGETWSTPKALSGPSAYGDPVATLGADGSRYYGYLDGKCDWSGCKQGHVWVARMEPGSDAFGAPVDVSPADPAEFYDKPWLLTGSDGTLIAVFAGRKGTYPDNVDRMLVSRSTERDRPSLPRQQFEPRIRRPQAPCALGVAARRGAVAPVLVGARQVELAGEEARVEAN